MRTKKDEKFKLESVEELLGVVNEESAMDIEISKIQPFRAHPFKVLDDDKMQELIDSISVNGILTPVLVRPLGMDTYEMISGHRRMHAAKIVGLTKIPTIIREMTDDEAVINMVDANVQREELLPSEKAFAYRMKLDAMKRQAGRPGKNNVSQNETNLRSDEILAIVVNRAGMVTSYFVDLETLIPVPGFIQLSDPDAVIHADTVDYKIENHNGNWRSVDYLIFDGKQYFLMENQKYGKQSAAVILDQYGKLIADHCKNGFDEDAKRKIREISGLKERLEKNENTGFAKRMKACYIYLENENCLHNVEVGERRKDDKSDEKINDMMQGRAKRKKSVLGRLYDKKCEVAKKWGKSLPKDFYSQ